MLVVACGGDDSDGDNAADDAGTTVTQPAGSGSEAAATTSADTGASNEGTELMQWNSEPAMALESGKNYGAVLHTNKGDITIDLDEAGAPKTVNNFVFLAREGYYTNVPFHRIISGFMVQTGDPTGTGAGGPGYRFADEPVTRDYARGTLAMANAGPNTNGSQFFICHVDLTGRLPKNYTIFGNVTEGLDILDAIASVPVGMSRSGERSAPTEPVTLLSVDITES
jgi:peptidylprolyl isomerase